MASKICLVLVSAVMVQAITGQILRNSIPAYPNEAVASIAAEALAYPVNPIAASSLAFEAATGPGVPGLNFGLSLAELSASNGPGLRVNSVSPLAASGVTVETDSMVIEGPLAVTGQLPFLGVVALEGPLPASGTGAVAYECGNGQVGIISEGEPAPVLTQSYPNALATGYPYGHAQGYPNAGLIPFPNGPAPGYPQMPQAVQVA